MATALGFALTAMSIASVARAEMRSSIADPFGDAGLFRAVPGPPRNIEVRVAVAADIDQDGDIDLVANTNTGLVVWVNDGTGHFDTQPPGRAPVTHEEEPATSWSGGDLRRPESLPTSGISVPVITSATHTPPQQTSRLLDGSRPQASIGRGSLLFAPRAPPRPRS